MLHSCLSLPIVIFSEQEQEEKYKVKIYEYGADYIASRPLTPNDISDKVLLMISQHKMLENSKDLV